MNCFGHASLTNELGFVSKYAVDVYDYLVKNNYRGIITLTGDYEERVKFCRWYNSNRCKNNGIILEPGLK